MIATRNGSLPLTSRVNQAFHELSQHLQRVLAATPEEISLSRRFVDLVPERERRRVWQRLREAGVDLPELCLSNRAVLAALSLVLLPAAFFWFLFHWSPLLCIIELYGLARKVTAPWATCPPPGCETMQEAALHLTRFSLADYEAGLWPQEEISAKVRLIICRALNIPFASISDATRLFDIC